MYSIVSLTITLAPNADSANLITVLSAKFSVTRSPAKLNELFVEGNEELARRVFGLKTDSAGNAIAGPEVPQALAVLQVVGIAVDRRFEGSVPMDG